MSGPSQFSPAGKSASVTIRGLTKTYQNERGNAIVAAVKGIDLEIQPGEFMVLVGPSGCGKSTTLRMIAGLEQISGGTIEIDGKVVNQLEPKDRGIAMVFQNYALYPHMTVFENMAFGLKLAKKGKAEIRETVMRVATTLNLDKLIDRKPQSLSGGQRQRVALGRAIVRNPRVFLFDEPLSNLDAKMRVQMRAEISRLHTQLKTTMIYVTHDQSEAMTLGDRICVMRDGMIMQVADPLTLYRKPQNLFVAGFIGSPPMNLLRGTIQLRERGLAFLAGGEGQILEIPLPAETQPKLAGFRGKEIVFGIRPERLNASTESHMAVRLELIIEVVEQMGAESTLYLKSNGISLAARVFGEHLYKPGDPFTVNLDTRQGHWFDPRTERVIDADFLDTNQPTR